MDADLGVNRLKPITNAGSTTPVGWQVTLPNQNRLLTFNADGSLSGIYPAQGGSISVAHRVPANPNTQAPALQSVTDTFGRKLQIEADNVGRITAVTDPAGGTISYTLPAEPILWAPSNQPLFTRSQFQPTQVVYADGSQVQYHYDEPAQLGGTPTAKGLLTGITRENGQRHDTFSYNANGAPIRTQQAGGVNTYEVQHNGSYATVTDPLGSQRSVSFTQVNGYSLVSGSTQPAGAGCSAASQNLSYDERGNKVSEDDFNGNRTCWAYDTSNTGRNFPITQVAGLDSSASCSTVTATNAVLPAGARKTSTQWHPTWRLPTRVAEPGRITTYVYNGQPDPTAGNAVASCAPASAKLPDGSPIAVLCKRVEQATTDTNGAAGFAAGLQAGVPTRTHAYSYNDKGQVLTHDGPRTDVTDRTTYTYYTSTAFTGSGTAASGATVGDLRTVTNAAGHTTTFNAYNPHGQVLQSTDPNGLITRYSYDARQRLTRISTGAATTSYRYDAAGNLVGLTLPDGATVTHTYDAAMRLVASQDHLGNRVDHVLDNAGNILQTTVKDASGTLRQRIQHGMDALGRVQNTQVQP